MQDFMMPPKFQHLQTVDDGKEVRAWAKQKWMDLYPHFQMNIISAELLETYCIHYALREAALDELMSKGTCSVIAHNETKNGDLYTEKPESRVAREHTTKMNAVLKELVKFVKANENSGQNTGGFKKIKRNQTG